MFPKTEGLTQTTEQISEKLVVCHRLLAIQRHASPEYFEEIWPTCGEHLFRKFTNLGSILELVPFLDFTRLDQLFTHINL